jgi:hypothetical protein
MISLAMDPPLNDSGMVNASIQIESIKGSHRNQGNLLERNFFLELVFKRW